MNGKWYKSKDPCWVNKEDLCSNFPLCNRKIPSRKAVKLSTKRRPGYCSDTCYIKYGSITKQELIQRKLVEFLKGGNSIA